jgi:replication factor C subunit 3/5
MKFKDNTLPWIEKYRPNKINNIIGQDNIIGSIKKMLKNGSFPHMLFHGTSGTGKTSTILSIIEELYGNNKTLMVMKLDASDDRGINSVREEIKGFAEKMLLFNNGIKLIILDEVDSMTFDAQFALRRIIELYSSTTRFCLICNYENKIIPAIKSRCASFRFNPIEDKFIVERLKFISEYESIKINKKCLKIIAKLSNGDLRKSINLLQSISMKNKKITDKLCYDISGIPPIKDIKKLFNILLDDSYDYNSIYDFFQIKFIANGYSLSILLKSLVNYMAENIDKIQDNKIPIYFSELSNLESMVARSTFGDIYFSALISIFKQ